VQNYELVIEGRLLSRQSVFGAINGAIDASIYGAMHETF
jgi:hypothetical protein